MGDSLQCTAPCVAKCGALAELPYTDANQLVSCFKETCGCRQKLVPSATEPAAGASDRDASERMKEYFDMIHDKERVEYLLLQQNLVAQIAYLESTESNFLSNEESLT